MLTHMRLRRKMHVVRLPPRTRQTWDWTLTALVIVSLTFAAAAVLLWKPPPISLHDAVCQGVTDTRVC